MMHQFEEINAAPMMTLNNRATSGDALKCARDIASTLQLNEQRARKRKAKDQRMYELAIELIIGDLFCNYTKPAAGWLYRSLSRDSFSDEIVGYKTFKQVILQFQQAGLIEVWRGGNVKNNFYEEGKSSPYHPGLASRFRASEKLIKLAGDRGLTFNNAKQHFVTQLPRRALLLKAAKKTRSYGRKDAGRQMKFDKSEQTLALEQQVQEINQYLFSQNLQKGLFAGYVRRFSEGDHPKFKWDRGGRLYAVGNDSYQLMKKRKRVSMLSNGEPVAEIDISASYLTMLHALYNVPLPSRVDLYRIKGISRDIVKSFVTATIGNDKFHNRWPVTLSRELQSKGYDLRKIRMLDVQKRVCAALPVLKLWSEAPISWSRLMYLESEQLINTIIELREKHDIPSYSVHDSIIIPQKEVELAAHILKSKFEAKFRIKYRLKANLSNGRLVAF
jgi:hypothetical protein